MHGHDVRGDRGAAPWGAWTLIELLTVLAIIAVLAALLMTGVVVARHSARRTECKANLNQIGLALAMYLDDYTFFPPAANMPSACPTPLQTIGDILPLAPQETRSVYRCPADTEYFLKERSSYEWNTFVNGLPYTRKMDSMPIPVLWDYEPFHRRMKGPPERNVLFTGGVVETAQF